MIRHEVSVHLNRPIEQVFSFVAEAKNLPLWQSNLVKMEQLSEGPMRAGTRFREVRVIQNKETEVQGEMTAFEPNRHFATKTVTKPEVTVSYHFAPEAGGTRVNYEFVMQTAGMMRLMEPMILGSIKKGAQADFEKLREVLEGG